MLNSFSQSFLIMIKHEKVIWIKRTWKTWPSCVTLTLEIWPSCVIITLEIWTGALNLNTTCIWWTFLANNFKFRFGNYSLTQTIIWPSHVTVTLEVWTRVLNSICRYLMMNVGANLFWNPIVHGEVTAQTWLRPWL